MKIKVVYYNVIDRKNPEIIEIEDDIEVFHKLLKCDCIDIVTRDIYNQRYSIIVDDEGALKEKPIVSAISLSKGACPLFGNLIICKSNPPELESLDDDVAKFICDFAFAQWIGGKILVMTR
ncbi:MAG: DUF3846 domain-containing protein [Clostridiales bacterium]|jgi:hypothetical protein|nr:DUF3846 domain-containing protein [Clostridiales bacterium]